MLEIDPQIKGGKHDSVETKNLEENSKIIFEKMQYAFFNINGWDHLFKNSTNFQVTDESGKDKFDEIKIGDFVKIKIPGPKSKVGAGYDWVKIFDLKTEEQKDCLVHSIVLSPSYRPNSSKKTAHFFKSEARNYFIIKKYPNRITAEVHGRNEIPNYQNLGIWDKARNFLVSHGGIFGFSKTHWKVWTKNILDPDILAKF